MQANIRSLPPPPPRLRVLYVFVWNVLLASIGLIIVTTIGEFYFRLTEPFAHESSTVIYVDDVGFLYEPNSVVYATNGIDYWTKSKVNSLGFLDREPPSNRRADGSCHVAIIGDSMVEAREVPLVDRLQIQLEKIVNRSLPMLDVTVSAYGRTASGQIHQLPFYEKYARNSRPDLLILVFTANDFTDNSSFLRNLNTPWDPDHPPHYYAQRSEKGEIELFPPDPNFATHKMSPRNLPKFEFVYNSFLGSKLYSKIRPILSDGKRKEKTMILKTRPHYALIADQWTEALEFTAFGLNQFKKRADRDGVSLVILATDLMSWPPRFTREGRKKKLPIGLLRNLADKADIPVVTMYDYVVAHGGRVENLHFRHDSHWNQTGHQWAAEAVAEYLRRNQAICDDESTVDMER